MTTPDPTLAARLAGQDLRIDCYHDKPTSGMWHCGPNSCWVQITHIPTQMTARAYHRNQWKARQAAMDCIEFMMSDYCGDLPQFPEALSGQLITLADAEAMVRAAVEKSLREYAGREETGESITEKYLRRYPDSKKTRSWVGAMVHLRTKNGIWRPDGKGYTVNFSEAWVLPLDDARRTVAGIYEDHGGTYFRARVQP